jgi:glycosyltransferase involved in cell wall biosynthesis
MNVSVILCTYNRCESLRLTLQSFCGIRVPTGITWELLLIDNNSRDATKTVFEEFRERLPIRYLFEPRQGKSFALNRGIEESKSDFLLFTDDDVDVDENWLAGYWSAAQRHPTAAFLGGKVIPRWESPPPAWLEQNSRNKLLMGVVVAMDYGNAEVAAQPSWPSLFYGANMALLRTVLQRESISFRTDLGPGSGHEMKSEDSILLGQLIERGHAGMYIPTAFVYHRNPRQRMTEAYVRTWFKAQGTANVRLGKVDARGEWRLFHVPRWWWRKLFASTLMYAITRLTAESEVWLKHESDMARKWGSICELRRMAKKGIIYKHQGSANDLEF